MRAHAHHANFVIRHPISYPERRSFWSAPGIGTSGLFWKPATKASESDWLLKTCLYHHNLQRTRTIKPGPGFPGSDFGFDQSRWVSRLLVKGGSRLWERDCPKGVLGLKTPWSKKPRYSASLAKQYYRSDKLWGPQVRSMGVLLSFWDLIIDG